MCVIDCPKSYVADTITNACNLKNVDYFSFVFLFVYACFAFCILIILLSCIFSCCKNKFFDVCYSVISICEFTNRCILLEYLWVYSTVFTLAVDFMNIIATMAIAVFFNFLFMSPIYAHSPHFRTLYKKFSFAY